MPRLIGFLTWVLLCCAGGSLEVRAQATDVGAGSPPGRLFSPSQYQAHSQNFAFAQDRRGVLYVGNFAGVLEYDGLGWRTIPTANISKVSALLTVRDTMYVGGNGEFGYLQPDKAGTLRFRSLSERGPRYPRLQSTFGAVLAVLPAPDGLYFVAPEAIFRWDGRTVREWRSPGTITAAFGQAGQLWVFQKQRGLSGFSQGRWQPARQLGGPPLTDVVALLPRPGPAGSALLITSKQGLFELAGTTIQPFTGPASTYLQANGATAATALADGRLAVATAGKGLVLLGADGRYLQPVGNAAQLSGQTVNALFVAQAGGLWLALSNGLLELEIPSSLTFFPTATAQAGEVEDIRRVGNTLYLALTNDLLGLRRGVLQPVPGVGGSFSLAEVAGQAYVATSRGVFRVAGNRAQLLTHQYAICLATSRRHPARLYVGTEDGLAMLTVPPGQPATYRPVPNVTEKVVGVREAPDGSVWLETLRAGLLQVLPGGEMRRYDAQRGGLRTALYNQLAVVGSDLLAYNSHGIFRYEAQADRFIPFYPFGSRRVADNWKNELTSDAAGNVWTVGGDLKNIVLYQQQKSGYTPVAVPFLPLAATPINVIYPDSGGVTWFGGRDGLVRYDAAVVPARSRPYAALIRRVQTAGGDTLYNGLTAPGADTTQLPRLPPDVHDVQFTFAAATFPVAQARALEFQYQLENYDQIPLDSAAWTTASQKEYTNLPAGPYTFRVRARDGYARLSGEARYSFEVPTPWYQSGWGIALEVLAAGLLLYALVRWRLAAAEREKQALETLIQERTEEVVSQKAELEKQSSELANKNDQLEKIDLIVQSINAEVDSTNLFQLVLAKFSVIRHLHSAGFVALDATADAYRYQALRGSLDLRQVQDATLTLAQAESRFLAGSTEVYEDIYQSNPTGYPQLGTTLDALPAPRSLITLVIQHKGRTEGFITLENNARPDAFDQPDIDLIRNLKEHLIAAFIKTRLLESLAHTLRDLENTQGELIRQEKLASVGQLAKGIVDRILNPLNYVTNFSQASDELITEVAALLQQQQHVLPTDALEEMLDELRIVQGNSVKIQEHSYSTTRILKDMQKLLREKSRDFVETDLNIFVATKARAVVLEHSQEHPGCAISLVLDLAAGPVVASLLSFEFGQVVQHLVSNACYTLAEKCRSNPNFQPEIKLRTWQAGGQVGWQLRDNGQGIAAREQARLFSPFFTTKPTAKGSGLGLYMAKDIVETHRGTITLKSVEGEFTELTVTLPAAAS